MIRVNFDKEIFDKEDTYTKGGLRVQLLKLDINSDYCIAGVIKNVENETLESWNKFGICINREQYQKDKSDLCLDIEEKKFTKNFDKIVKDYSYFKIKFLNRGNKIVSGYGKVLGLNSNKKEVVFSYITYEKEVIEYYNISLGVLYEFFPITEKVDEILLVNEYNLYLDKRLRENKDNPKILDARYIKSRQALTPTELKGLLDIGLKLIGGFGGSFVNRKTVSGAYVIKVNNYIDREKSDLPSLGITDLLNYLPPEIDNYSLIIDYKSKIIGYKNNNGDFLYSEKFTRGEIIEPIYKIVIWYLNKI